MKIGKHQQKKLLPRGIIQSSMAKNRTPKLNSFNVMPSLEVIKSNIIGLISPRPNLTRRDSAVANELGIALSKVRSALRSLQNENQILVWGGEIGESNSRFSLKMK